MRNRDRNLDDTKYLDAHNLHRPAHSDRPAHYISDSFPRKGVARDDRRSAKFGSRPDSLGGSWQWGSSAASSCDPLFEPLIVRPGSASGQARARMTAYDRMNVLRTAG